MKEKERLKMIAACATIMKDCEPCDPEEMRLDSLSLSPGSYGEMRVKEYVIEASGIDPEIIYSMISALAESRKDYLENLAPEPDEYDYCDDCGQPI